MRKTSGKRSKMGVLSASILWSLVLLLFVALHALNVPSIDSHTNRLARRGSTESPLQRHSRESFDGYGFKTVESSPKQDSNRYSDRHEDDRDPIRSNSSLQMSAFVNQHAILQVRASVVSIKSTSPQRSTLFPQGFMSDHEWKVTIDELPNENDLCTSSRIHWDRVLTLRWNITCETIFQGNSQVSFVVPIPSDCQCRVRTLIVSLMEYSPSLNRSKVLTRRLAHIQGNYRQSSERRMHNQIVKVDLQGEVTFQSPEQKKSTPSSFWTDILLYGLFSWLIYLFSFVPWTVLAFRINASVDIVPADVGNIKLSCNDVTKLIVEVADESRVHKKDDEDWNDGGYEPPSLPCVGLEDDSFSGTIEQPPTLVRHAVDPFCITFLRQERKHPTLVEKELLQWTIQASSDTATLESRAISSEIYPSLSLCPNNRSQPPNLTSRAFDEFYEKPNVFQASPSRMVIPYAHMYTAQNIIPDYFVEADKESEHGTYITSDMIHDLLIPNHDIGLLECHNEDAILQKETTLATSDAPGWATDNLITQQMRSSRDRDNTSTLVVDCEDLTDEAIGLHVETGMRLTNDAPVSTNDTTVSCLVTFPPAPTTEKDEKQSLLELENTLDGRDILRLNLNSSVAKTRIETTNSRQHIGSWNDRLWDRTKENGSSVPESPGGDEVIGPAGEPLGSTLPETHHEHGSIDSMNEQVYQLVSKSGASSYCSTLASDSDCPMMRTQHGVRRTKKNMQRDQASVDNEKATRDGGDDTFEFVENDSSPKLSIAEPQKTTKKPKRRFNLVSSFNHDHIQNVTSNVFAHTTLPLSQTLAANRLSTTVRKLPRNSKRRPRKAVVIQSTGHPSFTRQQSDDSFVAETPDICPDFAPLSSLVVMETQITAPVWSFSAMGPARVSRQHSRKRKRTSDVTDVKMYASTQRSKLKASIDRSNPGKQERTDKVQGSRRNRGSLHSNDPDIPRCVEFPVVRGRKREKI